MVGVMLAVRREGRKALRAALASWPAVDPETATFLAALRYPVRRSVELAVGERRGVGGAAAWWEVSRWTVGTWLAEAYDAYAART